MASFYTCPTLPIIDNLGDVDQAFGKTAIPFSRNQGLMSSITKLLFFVYLVVFASNALAQDTVKNHWIGWQSIFQHNCEKLGFDTSEAVYRQYKFSKDKKDWPYYLWNISYLDSQGREMVNIESDPHTDFFLPKARLKVNEKSLSKLRRLSGEKRAKRIAKKYKRQFYLDSHVFRMQFIERDLGLPFLVDSNVYHLVDTHLVRYFTREKANDSTFVQTIFSHLSRETSPTINRHYSVDSFRIEKSLNRYYHSECQMDSFVYIRKGGPVHHRSWYGYYSDYPVEVPEILMREGDGYFDHWQVVVQNPKNRVDTNGKVQRAILKATDNYSGLWAVFDTVYHSLVNDTCRVLKWTRSMKCGEYESRVSPASLIDTQSLHNSKWQVISRHITMYKLDPLIYPPHLRYRHTRGLNDGEVNYIQCGDPTVSVSYINKPIGKGELRYKYQSKGQTQLLASQQVIGGDTFSVICERWKRRTAPDGKPLDCGSEIEAVQVHPQYYKSISKPCFACTAVADIEKGHQVVRVTYAAAMGVNGEVQPLILNAGDMLSFIEGDFDQAGVQKHERSWYRPKEIVENGIITILTDPNQQGIYGRKKVLVPIR